MTLATTEDGKPFLFCEGTCNAWAHPGEYWISVRSTQRTAAGQKRIWLAETSKIDVRAREKDEQATTTTLGLIFLGSGLGVFSLALLTAGERNSQDGADSTGILLFWGSVLSTAAGLVLLLVGGARDTTVPNVRITPQ